MYFSGTMTYNKVRSRFKDGGVVDLIFDENKNNRQLAKVVIAVIFLIVAIF